MNLHFARRILISALVIVVSAGSAHSQTGSKYPSRHHANTMGQKKSVRSLELLGIRPGISMDSVRRALGSDGALMREIAQDSLSQSFNDKSLHIFLLDSIMCRLTYMRMVFVFDDASRQLRRFVITPRETSIAAGQSDDINAALLLYFGQQWGKPEINFDPPACFIWRTGNIEMRGFIKRSYPLWIMEG
jgi:hypothetical protein